ncbi:hypothetical protein HX878_20705 [Pseudomonas veronii]|uniref:hypothetical protein n=1 Tax=Pseudomonas veronii TaxID=76761 RepID=UPI0015A1ADFB|nr:hypothetical protein [Pseudomonas veronii]NWD57155.1 hypothetical protein [Pseudomonas veronii]
MTASTNPRITAYKGDAYEFPDEDLLDYSVEQLQALIRKKLPLATYQIDGLGGIDQVRVDHAQDLIDQARDLLLDKGMSFTQAEIEELEFLTWPPTESERIERETQQLAEAAERVRLAALRKQVEARSLATTQNAIDGKLADQPAVVQGIKLVLSRSGLSFSNGEIYPSGPSGTEVLSLVDQLQAIGVTDARLRSYTCSRVGVQFDTDPVPSWKIEMRLPVDPVVWLFLWSWYEQHQVSQSPTIETDWKDGNEPMSSWAPLSGLWPELESAQALSRMMDEISHPFMSQHISASQEKDVEAQNVMSRLEYWAYGHGYCGKGIPRYVRKLCAKTALHRAWLSGHNYCKWGWKADKELDADGFFDHIQS